MSMDVFEEQGGTKTHIVRGDDMREPLSIISFRAQGGLVQNRALVRKFSDRLTRR